MKQKVINYLKMVFKVTFGMDTEKAIWEDEIEIANCIAAIKTEYDLVEAKNVSIEGAGTTGYTSAKNNLYDSIMKKTYKLACKLAGFAKVKKDYVLLPMVDISYTKLSRKPEREAINRCLAILDRTSVLLPQLTTYKVTEPQLAVVRQEIKDYSVYLGDRSTVGTVATVERDEVDESISELREKIDTLDSLVEGLIEDESFISRYQQWRKIDDTASGKNSPNPPAK